MTGFGIRLGLGSRSAAVGPGVLLLQAASLWVSSASSTASGGFVDSLAAKASNGRTLTQTSTARPAYIATGWLLESGAANFDGSSAWSLVGPSAVASECSGSSTIHLLIDRNGSPGATADLVRFGSGGSAAIALRIDTSGRLVYERTTSGAVTTSKTFIEPLPLVPCCLTVVYDGTTIRLYRDGVEDVDSGSAMAVTAACTTLTVGSAGFSGLLLAMSCHAEALSAAQVQQTAEALCADRQWTAAPWELWLLEGQSLALGTGSDASTLVAPESLPYNGAACFSYADSYDDRVWGAARETAVATHNFGVVLDFARAKKKRALIRLAQGSTGLNDAWLSTAGAGTLGLVSKGREAEATTALRAPFTVAGVLWIQGEQDATDSADAAAYATNLDAFIVDKRADWADPSLAWVQTCLRTDCAPTYSSTVRAAQLAEHNPAGRQWVVDPSGLPGFDGLHGDNAFYRGMGQLLAAAATPSPVDGRPVHAVDSLLPVALWRADQGVTKDSPSTVYWWRSVRGRRRPIANGRVTTSCTWNANGWTTGVPTVDVSGATRDIEPVAMPELEGTDEVTLAFAVRKDTALFSSGTANAVFGSVSDGTRYMWMLWHPVNGFALLTDAANSGSFACGEGRHTIIAVRSRTATKIFIDGAQVYSAAQPTLGLYSSAVSFRFLDTFEHAAHIAEIQVYRGDKSANVAAIHADLISRWPIA